jgi:flagellar hook-associated protein 3 FlgL
MRVTTVSTPTMMNVPRTGVQNIQTEMMRLSREIVTARLADVTLEYGAASGRNVTLHADLSALSSLSISLTGATKRLDQSQLGLDEMNRNANAFLDGLLASMQSGSSAGVIRQSAQSALNTFISNANASDGHEFLFAGINTAVPPLAGYDAGPGAAVDAAFLTRFGITPSDPAVASISASDMADFLDNEFAALFDDPAWGSVWSSASDQPVTARVSSTETIDTSVSANTPAMRKLARFYTMVASLSIDSLGEQARQVVLNEAVALGGEAIGELINTQAAVGLNQNRLKDAEERLLVQQDIIKRRLGDLEGVDPAEAKVRFDMLSTEVEMSYSLTARLLQMSLLNYV